MKGCNQMIRKITREAKRAWDAHLPFKKDNTEIKIGPKGQRILIVFRNQIAFDAVNRNAAPTGMIYWGMCAWNTVTTRERLEIAGVKTRTRQGTPQAYDIETDSWRDIDRAKTYMIEESTGKIVWDIYN